MKIAQIRLCFSSAMAVGLLFTAVPAQGQVQDYSKGFEKFYTLGLPDVRKATYVKLDSYSRYGSSHDLSREMYDLRLSGNAWMLEENKQGKSLFVVGGCRVDEIYDQKLLMKERQEQWKAKEEERQKETGGKSQSRRYSYYYEMEDDGKQGGEWRTVDLAKDVASVLEYLRKMKEKEDSRHSLRYSNGYGSLFITAIHYHAKGFTNEANEIVDALFQLAEDRRDVIMQALNRLGDTQYDDVLSRFFRDENWEQLETGLTALLGKYAVGWEKALPVKKLVDNVRARRAQTEAPPLQGEGLTGEDKTLAQELASLKNTKGRMRYGNYGQMWIFPSPSPAYGAKTDDSVIARIQKRGMQSIPLLMALLNDSYLIPFDLETLQGSHRYYSRSSSKTMSEERILEMYNSLRRPASRGDIARQMISAVLPRGKEDRRRFDRAKQDTAELLAECKAWYEKHKDKPLLELARSYMEEGDENQQSTVLGYLLRNGKEPDYELIEKHFLESDRFFGSTGMLEQYVSMRGDKAKPFVEKYEARTKEVIAEDKHGMFKSDNMKKQMERTLAMLRESVSGKTGGEMLEQLLAGETEWKDVRQTLGRKLAREDTNEALRLVLDAALRSKVSTTSRDLILFSTGIPHLRRYNVPGPEEEDEPPALDIARHVELWKKLRADTREADSLYIVGSTVGDATLWVIETLYGDDPLGESRKAYGLLGRRSLDLLRKRADARLAGKKDDELPAIPSEENVTPEQRKKLLDSLLAAPAENLNTLVSGLKLDEFLALMEEAEDNEALNAKLVGIAHRVVEVKGKTGSPEKLAAVESFKNWTLDRKMIESLQALAQEIAGAGKGANILVRRHPALEGIEIVIREITPGDKEDDSFSGPMNFFGETGSGERYMFSQLSGRKMHAGATWPIKSASQKPGKGVKKTGGTDPGDNLEALLNDAVSEISENQNDRRKAEQTEFWLKADQFCEGKDNVLYPGMIVFACPPEEPEEKPQTP